MHLLDADLCGPEHDAAARAAWLGRAKSVGVWPRHPAVLVPAADVAKVERLGDLRARG